MQHQPTAATPAVSEPFSLNPWSPAFWSPEAWLPPANGQDAPGRERRGKAAATASPFGGLDTMMQAFNPMLKALAQSNSEILSLATNRAKALTEVPAKASQCRAPQDLAALQMQFWQTAYYQHADAAKRVVAAWGQVTPMAGVMAKGIGQALDTCAAAPAVVRDVMSIAGDKDPDSEPASVSSQSSALPLAAKRPLSERRSVA